LLEGVPEVGAAVIYGFGMITCCVCAPSALVRADASGVLVPVEGRAALQVIVRGPIYGTDNHGHQPWRQPPSVGEDVIAAAKVAG
jgi:hypothetical protein